MAVVHDGEVVVDATNGDASVLQVVSLSKPITAYTRLAYSALTGARLDPGRPYGPGAPLDLDAPVTAYRFPPSPFDAAGVTMRRLLSHTAGTSIGGSLGVDPPGALLDSLQGRATAGRSHRTGDRAHRTEPRLEQRDAWLPRPAGGIRGAHRLRRRREAV